MLATERRKHPRTPADNGLKEERHRLRFSEATRKDNPTAKIAAKGRVPLIPKAESLYSPLRPPELKFNPTGGADQLPELVARLATFWRKNEGLRRSLSIRAGPRFSIRTD